MFPRNFNWRKAMRQMEMEEEVIEPEAKLLSAFGGAMCCRSWQVGPCWAAVITAFWYARSR